MTSTDRPDNVAAARETQPRTDDSPASVMAALEGGEQLVALLEQMPALASPARVAGLLAEEIAEAIGADCVGIWRLPDGGGQGATFRGGVGFTTAEQQTALPVEHAGVAEALEVGGLVIDQAATGTTRATGLPGTRYPVLLLVPVWDTPWGGLLVLAGLDALVPEAFARTEGLVASSSEILAVSATLERLSDLLGAS